MLVRGRRGAYLRADAYKRKCGKAEDAQCIVSKNQNKLPNNAYKVLS